MIDRQKIVTLATKGTYTGKPRPWVIIQSNDFLQTDSVTVCLITGELIDGVPMLRIDVPPSGENGLREPSQLQVDEIVTVPRAKIRDLVGRLEDRYMQQLDDAVRYFLALER